MNLLRLLEAVFTVSSNHLSQRSPTYLQASKLSPNAHQKLWCAVFRGRVVLGMRLTQTLQAASRAGLISRHHCW